LLFAILRYGPEEEWDLRWEACRLAVRSGTTGRQVHTISLADLLWGAIEGCEDLDAVVALERERGFDVAHQLVTTYLSDLDWRPYPISSPNAWSRSTPSGTSPSCRLL
jgi:hypothetical protein